jgi:hypothetical protein
VYTQPSNLVRMRRIWKLSRSGPEVALLSPRSSLVKRTCIRFEITSCEPLVLIVVLPSFQLTSNGGFGGLGMVRSSGGRPCLKKYRSAASSVSATSVMPPLARPIRLIDLPSSPEACQLAYSLGSEKT